MALLPWSETHFGRAKQGVELLQWSDVHHGRERQHFWITKPVIAPRGQRSSSGGEHRRVLLYEGNVIVVGLICTAFSKEIMNVVTNVYHFNIFHLFCIKIENYNYCYLVQVHAFHLESYEGTPDSRPKGCVFHPGVRLASALFQR